MGTNYYHTKDVPDPCPHCEGSGKAGGDHVGKSSGGWTFGFQGTDDIRSYADWFKRLEAGGEIHDEYGRTVSLEEFKKLVESKVDAGLNHAIEYPGSDVWLDDKGHSFSDRDFS